MKALVTGGTGFIGSCVVDLLAEQGHSVRLFSRKTALPERFAGKDVSLFAGDLGDPDSILEAMDGMEVFYHIGEIRNTSPAAAKRNVDLVERVIGRLGPAGIRRIVFISSLTVAGIPVKTPADEGTAPAIALGDHYTRYKERCEKLLAEKAAGVEYTVIRPGVVYGPGSRYLGGLIAGIEKLGAFGIPFIGRGAAVAPLIYVKDLARAVYLAGTERDAAGQVFNLTDGLSNSWADSSTTLPLHSGRRQGSCPCRLSFSACRPGSLTSFPACSAPRSASMRSSNTSPRTCSSTTGRRSGSCGGRPGTHGHRGLKRWCGSTGRSSSMRSSFEL